MAKDAGLLPEVRSPVDMTLPAMPDFSVVRAESLDDSGRYKPQMVSWTASAQPWDHVDPIVPALEKRPPG